MHYLQDSGAGSWQAVDSVPKQQIDAPMAMPENWRCVALLQGQVSKTYFPKN